MQDLLDVTGKRACVTGTSSGIGRTLATALARAGATVVGIARRKDALEAWQEDCWAEKLSAEIFEADLSNPKSAEVVAKSVADAYGAPDILVNAAGINPRKPAEETTVEDWQKTLDLNLSTPFFFARTLVPAMKEAGWGRILNIASLQSARAMPNGAAYGASKGGVTQLTRAMAEAWSRHGVNCNAIAPGFFKTELTSAVFEDEETTARLASQTCIGRNGELNDLVGPALFLCSEASRYVTGQVLYVDGGFTAK